jgi:hypothetical protein
MLWGEAIPRSNPRLAMIAEQKSEYYAGFTMRHILFGIDVKGCGECGKSRRQKIRSQKPEARRKTLEERKKEGSTPCPGGKGLIYLINSKRKATPCRKDADQGGLTCDRECADQVPILFAGRAIDLDFFLAVSPFQQRVSNRRCREQVNRTTVWLASPEDLILLKRLANRPGAGCETLPKRSAKVPRDSNTARQRHFDNPLQGTDFPDKPKFSEQNPRAVGPLERFLVEQGENSGSGSRGRQPGRSR